TAVASASVLRVCAAAELGATSGQATKKSATAEDSGWATSPTSWPRRRKSASKAATILSMPPYCGGGTGKNGSVERRLRKIHAGQRLSARKRLRRGTNMKSACHRAASRGR